MDKRELLLKLLSLADRGVGGEAENAKRMAESIAKKYNVDLNEYKRVALPKLNSAKKDLMVVAANMCGCVLYSNRHNRFLLGKHCDLALDCYYYLLGLIPKEHKKDSAFIHSYAGVLMQRLVTEPGWVDIEKEIKIIDSTLNFPEAIVRKVAGSNEGAVFGSQVSLRRQADNKTRYIERK